MHVQRLTQNPHDSPLRRGRPRPGALPPATMLRIRTQTFREEKIFLIVEQHKNRTGSSIVYIYIHCPVGFLDQNILDFWWCLAVSELVFFDSFSKSGCLAEFHRRLAEKRHWSKIRCSWLLILIRSTRISVHLSVCLRQKQQNHRSAVFSKRRAPGRATQPRGPRIDGSPLL